MSKVAGARDLVLFYALKGSPASLASGFGASISFLPRMTLPAAHRDAKTLIAALRPEWRDDPAALEAATRRLWTSVARTYAEVAAAHRLVNRGHVTIENVAWLDEAMASGKPVICTFVHTGNWEISGIQLACRFPGRALAIYDPPKQPMQAAIMLRERRRMPADLVPMSRMVWRQALTRLRQPGGTLWVPADEFAFNRINAPFFGRPLQIDGNLGKIVRLALRTGAIVVPFYGERHPRLRFTSHILPPMTFEGDANDENAVRAGVKAIDHAITAPVISLIDQWYMALFYRDYAARPADLPATG